MHLHMVIKESYVFGEGNNTMIESLTSFILRVANGKNNWLRNFSPGHMGQGGQWEWNQQQMKW